MENIHKAIIATKTQRFIASLIDMILLMMLYRLVRSFYIDIIDIEALIDLVDMIISLGLFFIINHIFIVSNGQTIGKKILKIKVVDLTYNLPPVSLLYKRYIVYLGFDTIVLIGSQLSLINILMIFGKERRCMHDYMAGTQVVKV